MADSLLARKYVDGIYIPLGLLVVGTAIVKREWTAYALLLGIALGTIKFLNSRTFFRPHIKKPRKVPQASNTLLQAPRRPSRPMPSRTLSSRRRPSSRTM